MSTDPPPLADVMEERRRLLSLAYRMMGTLSEAEDVVQETYVRWYRQSEEERAAIRNPAAWLTRVASRVALDALTSARTRRERYIGQWLPEPVPADLFMGTASGSPSDGAGDPADRVTLDESVGTALLTVLEAMTPAERVSFVLHDVFALPFPEIAEIVGRTPAAVRQLATSGRRHVQQHRVVPVAAAEHDRAVRAFLAATRSGDLESLMRVLAPDVELRSDGGGVVSAARNAVLGTDRVARFVLGVMAKQPRLQLTELQTADGLGYRLTIDGQFYGVISFGVEGGRVADVWLVLNPAKLSSWLPFP
ncbi:MAG TPA: RNA polymerase sigma factor SigJ [Microlunatus sp.]|nr:RNA polymerase sigma factor SigJ [Microlunatus sp.]